MGAAANFAILAGSTITNTGVSNVTGDIGLSPGTAVTGFPPGILTGAFHFADATAATAKLAQASITVTTGATIQGKALTQTAAVTLDTNTIVK